MDLIFPLQSGHRLLQRPSPGKQFPSSSACEHATEQFQISDTRPATEIAAMLRAQYLDPVWKDWDEALLAMP